MCNVVVCAVLQSLCVGWLNAGLKKCVAHSLIVIQFFGFDLRPSLLKNSEPYLAENNLNSHAGVTDNRLELNESVQN